jgi:hypothetical protein
MICSTERKPVRAGISHTPLNEPPMNGLLSRDAVRQLADVNARYPDHLGGRTFSGMSKISLDAGNGLMCSYLTATSITGCSRSGYIPGG